MSCVSVVQLFERTIEPLIPFPRMNIWSHADSIVCLMKREINPKRASDDEFKVAYFPLSRFVLPLWVTEPTAPFDLWGGQAALSTKIC